MKFVPLLQWSCTVIIIKLFIQKYFFYFYSVGTFIGVLLNNLYTFCMTHVTVCVGELTVVTIIKRLIYVVVFEASSLFMTA